MNGFWMWGMHGGLWIIGIVVIVVALAARTRTGRQSEETPNDRERRKDGTT